MRSIVNRKRPYRTDEFATAYDTTIWSECKSGTGAVSIASGELKLNTPANNDIAALVTQIPHYIRNARIRVDVDVATSAPARAGIVVAKTKVTTSNPEAANDMIYYCLDAVNSHLLCKTDVGGTEKTILDAAWTDGDGTLQLDLDPSPTDEIQGSGVRAAQLMESTPIIGRLIDFGTADTFETDAADYAATPVQRVVLSRDVKRFRLEEVRAYMNSANAVTSGIALYEDAQATDVWSYSAMPYKTGDNTSIAKATHVLKTINDTPLPVTFNLERPGQVWFVQDYSGAPGDTTGYLVLVGKEVL